MRFFINLHDGTELPDEIGTVFASASDAKDVARQALVDMARDLISCQNAAQVHVKVRGENGAVAMTGSLSLVIQDIG